MGIFLIALGALALIGGIVAALMCGGSKKRALKKKSSKKRAIAVAAPAPAPAPEPQQPQGSIMYVPQQPQYQYAAPMQYAAPVATQVYAAPMATYAAPQAMNFDMLDRNHDGVCFCASPFS